MTLLAIERRLLLLLARFHGLGIPEARLTEMASSTDAGEPGVALESLCDNCRDHDVALPAGAFDEIRALAQAMGLAEKYWSRLTRFRSIGDCWSARHAVAAPGCAEADLAAFERRAGVQLPPPVRAYLKAANGMASEKDDEGFLFWPLDRWETAATALARMESPVFAGAEQVLIFADYFDWSWAYGLWLRPDVLHGSVWIVGGNTNREVARDFDEFFEKYSRDDASILG